MELGNLLFGNSRGAFPIERSVGWEDELYRLFKYIAICEVEMSYGLDFKNDTFFIMPYWWGDCTCGYDDIDDGHQKLWGLQHRGDCYQGEYNSYKETYGFDGDKEYSELKNIYKKYGFDTTSKNWWHGCAIRCTCDYEERCKDIESEYAKEFGNDGHLDTCKLVMPNFLHKPSGFEIEWYKYPLRDACELPQPEGYGFLP